VDILLDTPVFIWWDLRDPTLGETARGAMADSSNRIIVSAVSIWEISIKRAIGKLRFRHDVVKAVQSNGFETLDITPEHADLAGSLPSHHSDPFDRMLIAQAKINGLVLLSVDRKMLPYGVPLLGIE
jgi:PIN domain nuclease of toxin-antitoxin system